MSDLNSLCFASVETHALFGCVNWRQLAWRWDHVDKSLRFCARLWISKYGYPGKLNLMGLRLKFAGGNIQFWPFTQVKSKDESRKCHEIVWLRVGITSSRPPTPLVSQPRIYFRLFASLQYPQVCPSPGQPCIAVNLSLCSTIGHTSIYIDKSFASTTLTHLVRVLRTTCITL
jgi:hypothetical protein